MNIVDAAEPVDTVEIYRNFLKHRISETEFNDIENELTKEIRFFKNLEKEMHRTSFTDYEYLAQRLVILNKNALTALEFAFQKKIPILSRKSELVFCYPHPYSDIHPNHLSIIIQNKPNLHSTSNVYFTVLFNNDEQTSKDFSLHKEFSSSFSVELSSALLNKTPISLPDLFIQFYFSESEIRPNQLLYAFLFFSYIVFIYL